MATLDIAKTTSTPRVCFDAATKILHIDGESYPENSFEFYGPVLAWIRAYLAERHALDLDINVSYLNSSSTKCLLDLLDLLEEGHEQGDRVSVVWRYDRDNPRSHSLATEFQEEVTFPFSIAAYED
ncbi:SiaC family regulatory phosphoprotein [Trichlorobacter ammonificans]|uniref:SiaC family regulatory phosphoprotein domain-containing protein n=1 Tax=Trichlorobacter ammonificans TaxID=2916410 RepID=A0ABM9D5Q8_9BACT|nr:SiaC family regulatory phosphoprotein [Trichlorobacter ammonificans]CAH2030039.1 conserved protein of unknown function [Trichlorobacter ammonificans]